MGTDEQPGTPETVARAREDAALSRLPPWLRQVVTWIQSRWLGRILTHSAAAGVRVDIIIPEPTAFATATIALLIIMSKRRARLAGGRCSQL